VLSIVGVTLAWGCANSVPVPEGVTSYAFTGAHWFDGSGFVERTMYVVGSRLLARRPERVDSIVDLRGGWVVPPFGDAHTHNLDGPFRLDDLRQAYRAEGTLYVQVLTNTTKGAAAVRDTFDVPGSLDVVYGNGGITSTLGHPFLAYEPRAMGIFGADALETRRQELCRSRTQLENAYWFVDDLEDLDSVWPRWLAGDPDVLKIFLLRSEAFEPGEPCDDRMGHKGLDPELVPDLVERAHRAGRRVWAHIESAHDFEVAVLAGVDGLAHMPGYQMGRDEPADAYEISEDVAREAGRRGVSVTPTLSVSESVAGEDDAWADRMRALHRRNITLLKAHGVEFVVGSDFYGRPARPEVERLRELGVWTDAEILRMWAGTTPQAIFPDRQIGRLEDQYEASFLVLACDPLSEWGCVGDVRLIVKDGRR
jgi:imidazolonepropionase-like amidohydrolase